MTVREAIKKYTDCFGWFPYFMYDPTDEQMDKEDPWLTKLVNKAVRTGEEPDNAEWRYPHDVLI